MSGIVRFGKNLADEGQVSEISLPNLTIPNIYSQHVMVNFIFHFFFFANDSYLKKCTAEI